MISRDLAVTGQIKLTLVEVLRIGTILLDFENFPYVCAEPNNLEQSVGWLNCVRWAGSPAT